MPVKKRARKPAAVEDSDSSSSESSCSQKDIYKVEKILQSRTNRKGRKEYLIKWLGYTNENNTWEPRENITDICPELMKQFEDKFKSRPKKEYRRKRARRYHDSESDEDKEVIKKEEKPDVHPVKVLGVQFKKGLVDLQFVMMFSDNSAKLVPRLKAHKLYTQLLITYYEENNHFEGPPGAPQNLDEIEQRIK